MWNACARLAGLRGAHCFNRANRRAGIAYLQARLNAVGERAEIADALHLVVG